MCIGKPLHLLQARPLARSDSWSGKGKVRRDVGVVSEMSQAVSIYITETVVRHRVAADYASGGYTLLNVGFPSLGHVPDEVRRFNRDIDDLEANPITIGITRLAAP